MTQWLGTSVLKRIKNKGAFYVLDEDVSMLPPLRSFFSLLKHLVFLNLKLQQEQGPVLGTVFVPVVVLTAETNLKHLF